MTDRRRFRRRVPNPGEPGSRMRLRTGRDLTVLDVSSGGALVQGESRLLPGTQVEVHVITPAGRVLVRSRVLRVFVARLCRDRVEYRGALAFERQVDVSPGYGIPGAAATVAAAPGTACLGHDH